MLQMEVEYSNQLITKMIGEEQILEQVIPCQQDLTTTE